MMWIHNKRTMGKNTRRRGRIEIYRDEETEVDRTIGESVFKIWRERELDVKWGGGRIQEI